MQRVQSGQRLNIKASDWNRVIDTAEAYSRSGRSGAGKPQTQDGAFAFGKLDAAITTAGPQTGKTMTLWLGPAWGNDDAATSGKWPVHYATEELDDDTYVVATWYNGKTYIQPFACGGEEPE